ncbi:immunoglobulin-like domain-containing protein [Nocardioides gansuensis]|nr:immunoglobulin-like domain-containing protein [Nocardioides gansuensis]
MMRTRLSGVARAWAVGALALAASMGGVVPGAGPAAGAEGDLTSDLVGWWKLDESSGTVATDSSGNGRHGAVVGAATWNSGDGFTFSGGGNSSGNAITLPNNLLAGLQEVTVDFDVWVDTTPSGNNFIFNLGNSAAWPNGTGYLFVTDSDDGGRLRATVAENGHGTEQSASRVGGLTRGVWKHVTFSIDGGTPAAPGASRLYEDGVLVASNTNLTTNPGLMGTPDGTTTRNVLGRSAYAEDFSFKGRLRDFRIYSRALTAEEASASAQDTNVAAAEADAAALTLGDTTAVTSDLALPGTGPRGTSVSWATSDAAVVEADGTVHRPPYGQPDGRATLTATVTRGDVSRPAGPFSVTVLAEELDDAGKAQEAVDAVALVHPDDVRGNLTLPGSGLHGTTLTWSSGNPAVVTDSGEVTRPAHGSDPVDVPLTVTGTLDGSTATRTITVRVRPLPAPADHEAYAFAYFAGESTDDAEKIYFGASRGNDPLDYDVLNDGRPVLASEHGERGLRDPFLIRSPEGDRFYLLATDLKAYPSVDFGQAQETGSKYIEVWESTDLVNWSDQRHIKVSSDFAGNTWAPEAFYDEEAGEYVVYWASALYPTTDQAGRDIATSYQRMMYATTRDFVTFSEPKPWIDVKRGTGRGMIDATVVKDGDTYYRVVKDEASMTPRQERSTDLRATVTGSLPTTTSAPGWQLVKERVGVGQPNPWGGTFTQGEGPTVFPDNEIEDRWYMFIDQPSYHGGRGYLAFRTDDIASGAWQSVPAADLPSSPRHGTVIPVTQAELDRMRAAYQPELLVASVDDVTATTRQGAAPQLPSTVMAELGDGSTGKVEVRWDDVDPTSYAAPGTFTVRGTVARGSADHPVATVTVTDAADPVVTLSTGAADADDGWWATDPVRVSAHATDASGIDSVETSVDGAPWSATPGATGSALVSGDGTHTVTARALDTTGNRSAVATTEVRIDATDPVSRATLDAGRQVTVRAGDATSGVHRIETRVGSGSWTAYAGPFQVGDAATTVEYRAVDRAGNVEPASSLAVPGIGRELSLSSVAASTTTPVARYGATVPVSVRVSGAGTAPVGTVRVVAGDRLIASGELVDGRVRLAIDTAGLGVGEHALHVRYDGSATHRASVTTVAVTVERATSDTDVRVARSKDAERVTARVLVSTDPSGQVPDRVRAALVRRGKVLRSGWLDLSDNGRARWSLSTNRAGLYTVRIVTPDSETLAGSMDAARVRIR